jgi:putative CocE/NonD family hydrolase
MSKLWLKASVGLSFAVCALLLAVVSARTAPSPSQEEKLSKPGVYGGYSKPLYSEWVRSSQYVAVRDGTRLAMDVYRPAMNGKPVEKPYPVVWTFTPYRRAYHGNDAKTVLAVQSTGFSYANILTLTNYGYVVAAADVRGKGASYGTRLAFTSRIEAQDAYDLNEWLAVQPWSDGKVGMVGCSYVGSTVVEAMTMTPPHLKAAVIGCTDFEKYDTWIRGGVIWKNWTNDIVDSPASFELQTLPVDADTDRSMLKAAVAEHAGNTPQLQLFNGAPFRNSVSKVTHDQYWLTTTLSKYIDNINKSGMGLYLFTGWQDPFRREIAFLYSNLHSGKKLLIGPWSHCQTTGFDIGAEELRFFDYWLKGIQNGVMNGPPIYYETMNAPKSAEWQSAMQWPPSGATETKYYLGGGKAGSASSVNDGTLSLAAPQAEVGHDNYPVDFDVSCPPPGWIAGPCPIDEKGLTYSTDILTSNVQVTGHPVIHLWVSSTAKDGNFFAYLEDIDASGKVHMIADGRLRASHRALRTPPYNNFGLPWHRSFEEDSRDLPDAPVELVFDLLPTSNVFLAGHRIRVTITGADPVAEDFPQTPSPPTVTVYREAAHRSYISMPVVSTSGGGRE